MESFTFQYNGQAFEAASSYRLKHRSHHYTIIISSEKVEICPMSIRSTAGTLLWVQVVREGEYVQPHEYVQSIGVGLEHAGLFTENMDQDRLGF